MATRTVALVAKSFKKKPNEVVALAQELGFECTDADSELELEAIKALGDYFRGGSKAKPTAKKAPPRPTFKSEEQIQIQSSASSRTSHSPHLNSGRMNQRGSSATVVVNRSGSSTGAETKVGGSTAAGTDSKDMLRILAEANKKKEQNRRRQVAEKQRQEQEQIEKERLRAVAVARENEAAAAKANAKSEKTKEKPPANDRKPKTTKSVGKAKPTTAVRVPRTSGKAPASKSGESKTRKNGRKTGGLREYTKGEDFGGRGRGRRRYQSKALDRVSDIGQGGDFQKPAAFVEREIELGESIDVGALAQAMSIKATELIRKVMELGEMVTINQSLDRDTASIIIEEMGHKVKLVADQEEVLMEATKVEGEESPRSPVVTVMGHVDHGKTSLLDYIRNTKVAAKEAGGITQHIGAYHLETEKGQITFLDTPGHAAFSSMRARGANSTDIVVLVCAANDGVMPQTEEAVSHAKAAGVPIIVAVNKIDLPGADPQRVRSELAGLEVIPEEFGGDTQFVNVSAETGEGIDDLLEAISVQADVMELKAVDSASGRGLVLEAKLDRGRGAVVSLLVQNGTLKKGDVVLAGEYYGRVRSLVNDQGRQLKTAGPSIPIEMLGFNGTPEAGDAFSVATDERQARQLATTRAHKSQHQQQLNLQRSRLETMFQNLGKGEKRILKLVLKADVRGSLEAIIQALADVGNDEVGVNVLVSGTGGINESDVNMAMTYGALIFGFDVRPDKSAKTLIDRNKLQVRYYRVIYELIDDVKSILTDMLIPDEREEIVGSAEVREVFNSPRFGQIAGCLVVDGTVFRNKKIRVLRDSAVVYEGELESLRRFKDDVQEVSNGTECGIGVRDYLDVRQGDLIEVYETRQIARAL